MTQESIQCVVVEDSPRLRSDLVFYLQRAGMVCIGVADGKALDQHLAHHTCDVVVLDLGLPGEDGLHIAQRLANNTRLGLVILTARNQLEDRLAGWESGAHVYLVKPIPLPEVAAVVTSVYRRLNPKPSVDTQTWHFYPQRHELISPKGTIFPLTYRETLLLSALVEAPQQQIPRSLASEQNTGASLDALVHRLRRKLKDHDDPIRTVYGAGFVFVGVLKRY